MSWLHTKIVHLPIAVPARRRSVIPEPTRLNVE